MRRIKTDYHPQGWPPARAFTPCAASIASDAARRSANATQLQRKMDQAGLELTVSKHRSEWIVTRQGVIQYSGDFSRIKNHISDIIFSRIAYDHNF